MTKSKNSISVRAFSFPACSRHAFYLFLSLIYNRFNRPSYLLIFFSTRRNLIITINYKFSTFRPLLYAHPILLKCIQHHYLITASYLFSTSLLFHYLFWTLHISLGHPSYGLPRSAAFPLCQEYLLAQMRSTISIANSPMIRDYHHPLHQKR